MNRRTQQPNHLVAFEEAREAIVKIKLLVPLLTSTEQETVAALFDRAFHVDTRLSSEEARIVRRGERQLRRGQSKPWRTIKDGRSRSS